MFFRTFNSQAPGSEKAGSVAQADIESVPGLCPNAESDPRTVDPAAENLQILPTSPALIHIYIYIVK